MESIVEKTRDITEEEEKYKIFFKGEKSTFIIEKLTRNIIENYAKKNTWGDQWNCWRL